ncbi:MAG TPA: sulfatase-like hydrolase/transferase, partial [Pseudomonadales bacterium]|nr:sulfatase-like hydrolase/transferase [Pseudomonadales bacterium]
MISVSYGVVARWLTASLGAIVLVMMNPALAGNTPLPNVLLIVADDLGVGDLHSFSATAQTQTPTIDALAAQGMRF